MDTLLLDQKIRKIPDFPKPGILFYDITTLFEDSKAFSFCINELAKPYEHMRIDKTVGIDARGFLIASALAYKLGCGIAIVRKSGKLPYKTRKAQYEKEYGLDTLEMHEGAIHPGENVIICDDLLATGGTICATASLVEQMGGNICGISIIIHLSFLPGMQKLINYGYSVHTLIHYDSEKTKS